MTPSSDPLLDRRLYHFTHVDNLEKVLRAGALRCDTRVQEEEGCTEVGDQDLKAKRRMKQVPFAPGGVLADYVPWYFAPRSPMLFRIATRQVAYQGGEDPLVFFVTSIRLLIEAGCQFVFTDGHPIAAFTDFFRDPSRLDRIDWPVMDGKMWNNTAEDPDRQRRRQAEFLVHDHVPLSAVIGIATKTAAMATNVEEILTSCECAMVVKPRGEWYYQR